MLVCGKEQNVVYVANDCHIIISMNVSQSVVLVLNLFHMNKRKGELYTQDIIFAYIVLFFFISN